jgi:hypothetical protein
MLTTPPASRRAVWLRRAQRSLAAATTERGIVEFQNEILKFIYYRLKY